MQTQEILLTVFTGILAVAVLMQTLIFFGIYRVVRQATNRLDGVSRDLLKNVDKVTAKAEETLTTIKDIGDGLSPIRDKMVNAAEILHQRVIRVDDFLEETTNTARLEVQRMKVRIESAADRTEQLLETLHDSILVPVKEINAITRGLRAGFDLLFRRRRNPSGAAVQDEEMFI